MLYFISGILFQELILPLLVTAVEVLSTKLESLKAKNALDITKINTKIRQISEEEPLEEKRVIGFVTDSDVTLEEDDEENEEED